MRYLLSADPSKGFFQLSFSQYFFQQIFPGEKVLPHIAYIVTKYGEIRSKITRNTDSSYQIVVIPTAQLHSKKAGLSFCTGLNTALSVLENHNGGYL